MKYLFILGRNFELSKAELLNFCDEVYSDKEKSLFIGENLKFDNPRNLPKTKEQIFLDRLGGTIRFCEIIDEFNSDKSCLNKILKIIKDTANPETVPKVGFSVFGGGKSLLGDFINNTKRFFQEKNQKIRVENFGGKNMSSGQIFDRRLLQKGNEFIIWKNKNTILLAKTCASQNLRNYTLRDRKKSFRDAKMGMLPPKLAQILINLNPPKFNETIFDPFCGSGTTNAEASVIGYKTEGSDINPSFVSGAQQNFLEMSEKFRFPEKNGSFSVKDATQINWKTKSGVICTEGFLGTNFEKAPTEKEIKENYQKILKLWLSIFEKLHKSKIKSVSFCLPFWNIKGKNISLSKELFQNIKKYDYTPLSLFNGEKTFLYKRDKAFVAREICVLVKN